MSTATAPRALTPREFARRYRMSADRVRALIARGELRALNLGTLARPRLVVTPEAAADFERRVAAQSAPTQTTPRPRRVGAAKDYFPDFAG